jgi:hypothetical protein
MNGAKDLLEGAIDMHVHAFPDAQARYSDCVDLMEEGRRNGLAGILIKDHLTVTSDRAYILNRLFPGIRAYGAIALNYSVGGLNPSAVEAAVKLGAVQVYMPTYCAANQISKWGAGTSPSAYPFPGGSRGISLLDEKGRLRAEVGEILEIIASSNVILGTGHVSVEEILPLLTLAREVGVRKMLVTHPSMRLIDMSVSEQREAVRLGAYVEHCYVVTTRVLASRGMTSVDEIAAQVREVGPEKCIMSTDFGQRNNPSPIQGFMEFIDAMLQRGFTEGDIRKIVRENPSTLLQG